MNNNEKCDLLKYTIYQLYSKEGRSKSYISKLLKIDRKVLTYKIKEWNFDQANIYYMTVSNKKYLDNNRDFIKSKLDKNVSISDIARELNIGRSRLKYLIERDEILKKSCEEYHNRINNMAEEHRQNMMKKSSRDYIFKPIKGEHWKHILGYRDYEISDFGRVRNYAKQYKTYYILAQQPNKNNNRLYVRLVDDNGKSHNLQVSRLVGFAFVKGYKKDANTINHKDGNVANNKASNLEWLSQKDNNIHSYKYLRKNIYKKYPKKYIFDKILYKNKYEFKTIAAFARFLKMSETQVRRYLDKPEDHDIKLLNNCND